jgi:hypothetical protein
MPAALLCAAHEIFELLAALIVSAAFDHLADKGCMGGNDLLFALGQGGH